MMRSTRDLASKIDKQLVRLNIIKTNNPIKNWAEGRPEQTFVKKKDRQMAKRHMKRCSTLLIIREMQIKTGRRYHLTPDKMAIIKKPRNYKHWRGQKEKRTLLHCWWECKFVKPLWRTVWRFLKKLKTELPYHPVTSLLGMYPEKYMV